MGDSVMTNTIVDKLAVSGPIGMWIQWVTKSVLALESAHAANCPAGSTASGR